MDELLKLYNPKITNSELTELKKHLENEKPKLSPKFNLAGFLFGYFYLLFKKAYTEALVIFILSMLVMQIGFILHSFIFLGLGLVLPNILVGWFFYFMYANKFLKDKENCSTPIDKECLKSKGENSYIPPITALLFIILLFWPVIYGTITKQDITTQQNKYINIIMEKLK
jgi:hypothetical protein